MSADSINTARVISSMFDQNAYLVWKEGESQAVAVDPGFEVESLLRLIRQNNLNLAEIWITHGHADHIAGLGALKKAFPDASIVIGVNESAMLTDAQLNLSAPMGFPVVAPAADRTVAHGETFQTAGLKVKVLEIPGHSPGSVVFVVENASPAIAIVGDVVFAGSVGRADFPGGNGRLLVSGIRSKLFTLPPETIILPGHGPKTTVGREKQTNPYAGDHASVEI